MMRKEKTEKKTISDVVDMEAHLTALLEQYSTPQEAGEMILKNAWESVMLYHHNIAQDECKTSEEDIRLLIEHYIRTSNLAGYDVISKYVNLHGQITNYATHLYTLFREQARGIVFSMAYYLHSVLMVLVAINAADDGTIERMAQMKGYFDACNVLANKIEKELDADWNHLSIALHSVYKTSANITALEEMTKFDFSFTRKDLRALYAIVDSMPEIARTLVDEVKKYQQKNGIKPIEISEKSLLSLQSFSKWDPEEVTIVNDDETIRELYSYLVYEER